MRWTHIVLSRTYQVRIILDNIYVDLVDARNRHAHRCNHSKGREGSLHTLSSASYEVSGWISVVSTTTHRALPPGNVVGLLQQILARPAMGSTGVFFSTTSFLHPTLITMLIILFDISSYCACMLPAVSQSILSHVPDLRGTSGRTFLKVAFR